MKKIIGIIPAAGTAERLSPIPFSKELFPIGFYKDTTESPVLRPKPVIHYLIEQMQYATKNIFLIINPRKCDIVNYLKSGELVNIDLAYLIQDNISGMPFALDLPYTWIDTNTTTIFGMPDTIFEPKDSYQSLLNFHYSNNSDLTLGLFPSKKPQKYGMVKYRKNNDFIWTYDKPRKSSLHYMWGIACWEYSFSNFLHKFLSKNKMADVVKEIVLGEIFNSAKKEGLNVKVFPFSNGEYIDIGSLDDLNDILCRLTHKNY